MTKREGERTRIIERGKRTECVTHVTLCKATLARNNIEITDKQSGAKT